LHFPTFVLLASAHVPPCNDNNAENCASDEIAPIEVVLQVSVEERAPPAVANAYLNSFGGAIKRQLTGGVRGCIIKEIAYEHAHNSKYGDRGGPYSHAMIIADVQEFSADCAGPTLAP
jgi:hypothetical protein